VTPSDDPGTLAPIQAGERLVALDALRGFALLGIALMNIEYFTRPLQGMVFGLNQTLTGADRAAAWLIAAFVQGKFWALFSLLFGMGFAVMFERAEARPGGGDFAAVYARRLGFLLLIGLAHALLLWAGDILVPYALAGLLMILMFRSIPVGQLWRVGLLLHVLPLVLVWFSAVGVELMQLDPKNGGAALRELAAGERQLHESYAAAERIYRDGSWMAVTGQRWRDTLMQYGYLPMTLPMVLGVFLLGAWSMRAGVMRDVAAHRRMFVRLLAMGGPLGAALAIAAMPMIEAGNMAMPSILLAKGITLMTAASLLLCLAYASAIVLALQGPWPGLARWLAPLGRMALSNYLLQSALFGTLFYGYGFGLWGQVPRAWQVALVAATFAAQMLLSRLWLARYRYGPVEWLWRAFTYGRVPRLRH
jgi:uncharacterized protein